MTRSMVAARTNMLLICVALRLLEWSDDGIRFAVSTFESFPFLLLLHDDDLLIQTALYYFRKYPQCRTVQCSTSPGKKFKLSVAALARRSLFRPITGPSQPDVGALARVSIYRPIKGRYFPNTTNQRTVYPFFTNYLSRLKAR